MNVQRAELAETFPQFAEGALSGNEGYNGGGYETGLGSGSGSLDIISRMVQSAEDASQSMPFGPMSFLNPFSNPISSPFMQMGQQAGSWMQQAGSAFQRWMNGTPDYGSEKYFSNASGSSVGDPHLSFNGSTWNDMQSEPDLLHSDSIRGGYQLSTQTTPPSASGVTYNQSATVTTHGGRTQVSLNNNGNATITQDGVTQSLTPGQTVQLGNETVTCNQNGSLQITSQNENGGQITTTMTQNGQGVDVNVSANNLDLGGAMVNGSSGCPSHPQPQPVQPPSHNPEPEPIHRRPPFMQPIAEPYDPLESPETMQSYFG